MENEGKLVPVFIPSLVAILLRREKEKGTPLTEQEVLSIRDRSSVIMLRDSIAAKMAQDRGYDDIDPAYCWEQWQKARKELDPETTAE